MSLTDLNWFDWILVLVLIVSMALAFRRGLVRAIFGMVGFVGGFLLAAHLYDRVGDWFNGSKLILAPTTGRIVGFLLIVVAVACAFEIAGRFAQKGLKFMGLSFLDRLLGSVFGFARGCLIGIGILMVVTSFAPQSPMVTTSALSPYFFAVTHDVSFLVPQDLQRLMLAGAFNLEKNPPHWINGH